MAPDARLTERDTALRAVLVQRANASRSRHRSRSGIHGGSAPRRLQLLVTASVLAAVVALSAAVITAGQSRLSAASRELSAPSSSSTDPATQTSAPNPSPYSGPLVAMDGARLLTRAQLHAWTLAHLGDSASAAIGEQQDWLNIQCMAKAGYLYDPTVDGTYEVERGKTYGLTARQRKGYDTAFWGPAYPGVANPYSWRTAGCQGRSVHLTGQDDNH